MTRRDFMMLSTAGAVMGGRTSSCAATTEVSRSPAAGEIVKRDVPPRNRRPYTGLDWSKVIRVKTTTHGLCLIQRALDVYL